MLAAVYLTPLADRETYMSGHEAVEQHHVEKLKHNWKYMDQLSDEHARYCKQFLGMLINYNLYGTDI